MMAWLIRWALRVVLGALALLALTYAADAAVFTLRGGPMDRVTVNRYLAVPLKGNKTEFDFQGSESAGCARALFPQGGNSACWYLRRHSNVVQQL